MSNYYWESKKSIVSQPIPFYNKWNWCAHLRTIILEQIHTSYYIYIYIYINTHTWIWKSDRPSRHRPFRRWIIPPVCLWVTVTSYLFFCEFSCAAMISKKPWLLQRIIQIMRATTHNISGDCSRSTITHVMID